jgi:hypothetical protein
MIVFIHHTFWDANTTITTTAPAPYGRPRWSWSIKATDAENKTTPGQNVADNYGLSSDFSLFSLLLSITIFTL